MDVDGVNDDCRGVRDRSASTGRGCRDDSGVGMFSSINGVKAGFRTGGAKGFSEWEDGLLNTLNCGGGSGSSGSSTNMSFLDSGRAPAFGATGVNTEKTFRPSSSSDDSARSSSDMLRSGPELFADLGGANAFSVESGVDGSFEVRAFRWEGPGVRSTLRGALLSLGAGSGSSLSMKI